MAALVGRTELWGFAGYAGSQLNEYIHWHVEEGRKLTGPQLSRIEAKRTALYERLCGFKGEYEFFVLPVNQVLPFDVSTHYPTEIAGVKMENYLAWMKSAYYISAAGNPAMSVPCAFSSSGLPIGMQIVGPSRLGAYCNGYAFEQATHIPGSVVRLWFEVSKIIEAVYNSPMTPQPPSPMLVFETLQAHQRTSALRESRH